jgi:N-acetylglucosamine kinase-like BadF-type ATPase
LDNKQMQHGYLLGVDVGSSKTHALITDCSGKTLGFGEAGGGNHDVVGVDGFKHAMQRAIQSAIQTARIQSEDVLALGLGISGYDWPSQDGVMVEAIEALEIGCPYQYTNDVLLGLIAGSSEGWGVAVVAGTGNNVRGRNRAGQVGRITGNSVYFGEIGGGSEIVWLTQVAVTHAWTQRSPKTALTQMLISFTEAPNEFELIQGIATGYFHLPPFLAEEVFRIAQEGDRVALDIINTSARELALNVNAVVRQLALHDEKFDLVMIGSIFQSGEIYLSPFRETVLAFAPHANLVHLTVPPVVGSVLLAAQTIGIEPGTIKDTVVSSISDYPIGNDQEF